MIYLDNAATTFPKPRSVVTAMDRFMAGKAGNPGRSGHKLSLASAEEVYRCREAAAEMFRADGPECVAFFLNATQAINAALKGALTKKCHVVTSNLEHNAVMRPLAKLAEKGIEFSTAAVFEDDDATVESFRTHIRPDTAMIACTHASNVTGKILPIQKIGEMCRNRGILFLVDASQTAGVLDIDMKKAAVDYLCMPGHKSLYGPMGTGMLITMRGESLNTLIEGGTGSNSVDLAQPDFMPDRLESGTVNAVGIAGLRAGMSFVKRRRSERIYAEELAAAQMLYDLLASNNRVLLYTPRPDKRYVPIVSFNVEGLSSVEAASRLDKLGFALRGGLHCSPAAHRAMDTLSLGMIRASFGAFNDRFDARKLAEAVRSIF